MWWRKSDRKYFVSWKHYEVRSKKRNFIPGYKNIENKQNFANFNDLNTKLSSDLRLA